jgi:hypothetical protein
MPTQVRCSQCNSNFIVQVRTILDVGQEPEVKEQLLKGEINYARCPQCGAGGILSAPLLYHDPAKELLISFMPAEMGMSDTEQEEVVGSLVNAVMGQLPAEERKGYFLQPKTVLTFEGLYDAILEADGISKEMLDRQRAQLQLISSLLSAVDDEPTLDKLVQENRARLDYGFFLLLSDLIEAREEESPEAVEGLAKLRNRLLERVDLGGEPAPTLSANLSFDDWIAALQEAAAGPSLARLVAANRERLDYGFFQNLTARIEAADAGGQADLARELTELRGRILEEIDALNRRAQETQDRATLLLFELLEAPDQAAAVRAKAGQIDEYLLGTLVRVREAAERNKDADRVARLSHLLETITDVLEENLPPETRLINKLLRADYPDGTNRVLEQSRGMLTDEFMKTFDEQLAELEETNEADLVEHLKQVRGQIVAKRTILRAGARLCAATTTPAMG